MTVHQLLNDLPDFAYFDHSIHLHKGIGCSTCHGQVDEMPLMWRTQTLNMDWCLSCHRHPDEFIRDPSKVTQLWWGMELTEDERLAEGRRRQGEKDLEGEGARQHVPRAALADAAGASGDERNLSVEFLH